MIVFIFYITSIFFVTIGFGLCINNYLTKQNLIDSFGLGETGLLGFYFLLLISYLLHFFIPINYFVTTIIFVLGILFFFYFKKILIINLSKKYIFLILILIFPALFSIKGHPDLELYHLPYLNYLKDFKIIFGIANANDFFAFQSWNDIAGTLRLPLPDAKGLNLIPAIFFIYALISFIEISEKSNNTSFKIFIYLIIIFAISKYYKIYEYSGHVPPLLLGFLINIYFYKLILDSKNALKDIISKIIIFSSFVLLLRMNYIFLFPIILFILIKYKSILFSFVLNKKILIIIILIPLIHFTKNIIHTGCFVYPVDTTCFSKEILNWSVGKKYAKLRYDGVSAAARGWVMHVHIDGEVEDRMDYLIPLKKNKIFSHTDYINQGNIFWIKYWLLSRDAKKILNNFIIIIICSVIIYFLGNFQKNLNTERNISRNFLFLLSVFLSQLLLWFLLTPQTIYGGDVATVVFISFLSSYLLKKLNFNNSRSKIVFLSLFLVSLSYFEINNIQRTYNDYFQDNNISIFPWIKIKKNELNIDYQKLIIDENSFNVQKKIIGRKIGSPDRCGSTPMICIPQERTLCIKGVEEKFNYLFIIGDEISCIEHLKANFF